MKRIQITNYESLEWAGRHFPEIYSLAARQSIQVQQVGFKCRFWNDWNIICDDNWIFTNRNISGIHVGEGLVKIFHFSGV